MKRNKYPQDESQKPASGSQPPAAGELNGNENDFAPSQDEVARRAYFAYVNQGSPPGRDVQHWLEAEDELLKERNLTRVHGFHNRT
jgi:hypothetical protein